MKRVVGDDMPFVTVKRLLREVEEKFHVFHIMIGGNGNEDILPGHKILISRSEIDLLPEIIIGTIRLQNGEKTAAILADCDEIHRTALGNALGQLRLSGTGRSIRL